MKITWHIEGGIAHFPGLAQDRTVDVDALPKARATALRETAERALAGPAPARARGADMRTFVVKIEGAKQSRTLRIVEPAENPDHAALIEKLQQQ